MRVQQSELDAINAAAKLSGELRAEWLRRSLVNAASAQGSAVNKKVSGTAVASWLYREAGGFVKMETSQELPRVLWERLVKYVAMLEPKESQ